MKSRDAILRLGAKEEGYFRKHKIYPDGRNRDSGYFSIVDDEWARAPSHGARKIQREGGVRYRSCPQLQRGIRTRFRGRLFLRSSRSAC
jgi:hypothetical protein